MYLAAIGNIRGNLPALRAVLAAIDDAGIQTIVNTGNCAAGNPWVNECIELLRSRQILSVQGEEDRRLVHFLRKRQTLSQKLPAADFEKLQETHDTITSENLEYLRALPRIVYPQYEGVPFALFHGTPTSQADSLDPSTPDDWLRRIRETSNAQVLVFNGGPDGFVRSVDQHLFVGTGFVDRPQPTHALIDTEIAPPRAKIILLA